MYWFLPIGQQKLLTLVLVVPSPEVKALTPPRMVPVQVDSGPQSLCSRNDFQRKQIPTVLEPSCWKSSLAKKIDDRPDDTDLLVWAYKNFHKGRISHIIDPSLTDSADMDQVKDFIEIALRCVEHDKKGRPSMETVSYLLQSKLKNEIGKPGTYRYEGGDQSEPQISEEAKAIEHMSAADEHQIQSQRGLSNANQIIKEGQVKNLFTGVKILESSPFGVPESQHDLPPQDESVGTLMPKGTNHLLSLSEPSADKEKRIPQPSSPEAIVDQHEMKEPELQELARVFYEYPEINEESDEIRREIQLLVEYKMETQKKLKQVSSEFEESSKEWRNGNLDQRVRLIDSLLEISNLKVSLEQFEKAIERCESEKSKRIPKSRDLHGAILTTQNEILEGKVKRSNFRWSPRRLKVSRERIQKLDKEVEEHHQSIGRPAGSQAMNFYEMRAKENNLEQSDFDIWHLQSSRHNPFFDSNYIEDSMNKLDQEMALSYGQLKTLVHKFKKGKSSLPSIFASLLESHEKGKEIVELDEEKSYMEVKQYMSEIMKDIGEGIEHVDHYIKALTKWNKCFQIINIEGLKGATATTTSSNYKSWSERINAEQASGDSSIEF